MMNNRDYRLGYNAFRAGKPFNAAANIDWQLGWNAAQADARLDKGENT